MSDDKNNKFNEHNSRYDFALKDKIDMFAIIKNKRHIFSVEFMMMLSKQEKEVIWYDIV